MASVQDLLTQQKALERQQALVQALMGARFGGQGLPYTPLRAIADVASGVGGALATQRFGEKQDELSKSLVAARAEQMEKLLGGPEGANIPGLMSSGDPELVKLAQALAKVNAQKALGPADLLKAGPDFDPTSRAAAAQGGGIGALSAARPEFIQSPGGAEVMMGPGKYAPKPAQTTVNVGGEGAFSKRVGQNFGDIYTETVQQVPAIDATLSQLNRAEAALDEGAKTGTGAGVLTSARSFLSMLGLGDGATEEEVLRALNTEFGLSKVQQTKGAISNAEMELFLKSAPGLMNSVEGNRKIIEAMRRIKTREREVATRMEQYVAQNGQLDGGFFREMARLGEEQPIFDGLDLGGAPSPTAPTGEVQIAPETEALLKKYLPRGQGAAR